MKMQFLKKSVFAMSLLFAINSQAKSCLVQMGGVSLGPLPLMKMELSNELKEYKIVDDSGEVVFAGNLETKGYVTTEYSSNFGGAISNFTFVLTPADKGYVLSGSLNLNDAGSEMKEQMTGLVYGCGN